MKFQYRCSKNCGVYGHLDIDFDFKKFFKDLKAPLQIVNQQEIQRKKLNCDFLQKENDLEVIRLFNFPHKEGCKLQDETMTLSASHSAMKNDQIYLENLIRSIPLQTPKFFRNEALKNNHIFNLREIETCLYKIRKEIFPVDSEIIFSPEFCLTKTIYLFASSIHFSLFHEKRY